jgi:hypothetical protein
MQTIRSVEHKSDHFDIGAAARPCLGETVSGDLIWFRESEKFVDLVLIDALGHGSTAHAAAAGIRETLSQGEFRTTEDLVMAMHHTARNGVGAAASTVRFHPGSGVLETASVGNTTIRIVDGSNRSDFPSSPGTLGQSIRRPKPLATPLKPGSLVILFSDGISSEFDEPTYTRFGRMSARSIARLVVHRYGKAIDDASVAVLKLAGR